MEFFCLIYNKHSNTRLLEDMEFFFSCSTRYRCRVEHSKRNFISFHAHVLTCIILHFYIPRKFAQFNSIARACIHNSTYARPCVHKKIYLCKQSLGVNDYMPLSTTFIAHSFLTLFKWRTTSKYPDESLSLHKIKPQFLLLTAC